MACDGKPQPVAPSQWEGKGIHTQNKTEKSARREPFVNLKGAKTGDF